MGIFDRFRKKKSEGGSASASAPKVEAPKMEVKAPGMGVDKSALDRSVNKGFEEINRSVVPGSEENTKTLGKLAPNENQNGISVGADGMIKKNPNMLGLSNEEVNKGVKTEMPDMTEEVKRVKVEKPTPDYESMANEDFLGGLAPMSEEEEKERVRRAEAVTGIGHLGNSLAALANVFSVGANGAPSQQMGKVDDPDVRGFLDRGRQQRSQYAQMKEQQKQREYARKVQEQEYQLRKEKAEREAKLAEALAPYKENEAMFKAKAAEFGATKAQAEALYAKSKAEYAPTEFANKDAESKAKQAANYASVNERNAKAYASRTDAAIKAHKDDVPFYTESDGEIVLTKERANIANLSYIHQFTGESVKKENGQGYEVGKSREDMMSDIARHLDKPEVVNALKEVSGGRKASKPKATSGGSSSSSSSRGSGASNRGGNTSSSRGSGNHTREENLEEAKKRGF